MAIDPKNLTREQQAALVNKGKSLAIKIAVGFFIGVTLFSSYSTVGPGERGVRVTMGKTGEEVLNEGPHLKVPFLASIRTMSVRIKKSQDTTEAATKDMQKVTAIVALNWTINPESVGKMLREIGDESSIENNIIAPAVSEVLKAATSKMTAEEVLSRRIELKDSIDHALVARLTAYGLVVKDISLVDLDFTKEFNHAVEQKQIAEQQAKQASYVAEKATQDAIAVVNTAKGDADATLVKATAQAKAQQLLKQTLTKEVLTLKYLETWNGQLPQVMSGNGGVMMQMPMNGKSSKSEE